MYIKILFTLVRDLENDEKKVALRVDIMILCAHE